LGAEVHPSVTGNDHHVGGLGYLREQFAMGMPLMLLDMQDGERR
jgi:hypothetical protein